MSDNCIVVIEGDVTPPDSIVWMQKPFACACVIFVGGYGDEPELLQQAATWMADNPQNYILETALVSDERSLYLKVYYEGQQPTGNGYMEARPVFDALLCWLKIRAQEGYCNSPTPPLTMEQIHQLSADIDHSSLLRRLLDGKQAFTDAPPRSMSYPWYSLLENQYGFPLEVYPKVDENYVLVDQFRWDLIKQLGDDDYLLNYNGNIEHYRLNKDELGQWKIQRLLQWPVK